MHHLINWRRTLSVLYVNCPKGRQETSSLEGEQTWKPNWSPWVSCALQYRNILSQKTLKNTATTIFKEISNIPHIKIWLHKQKLTTLSKFPPIKNKLSQVQPVKMVRRKGLLSKQRECCRMGVKEGVHITAVLYSISPGIHLVVFNDL